MMVLTIHHVVLVSICLFFSAIGCKGQENDEQEYADGIRKLLEPAKELSTRAGSCCRVSCGGHFAATCSECPQGHGAGWCNEDCKWEKGQCVDKNPPTPPPTGDCKTILLSGGDMSRDFRGLYFKQDVKIGRKTPNTAVYDDMGSNYIYHRTTKRNRTIGWVIAAKSKPWKPLVRSNIHATELVQGGPWDNGVTTTCLDGGKCYSSVAASARSVKMERIEDVFPFNGKESSENGRFCSRLESELGIYEYTNRASKSGHPIYASRSNPDELLVFTEDKQSTETMRSMEVMRPTGQYRFIKLDRVSGEERSSAEFSTRAAKCVCQSYEAIPASSIHGRWSLPRMSLSGAREWELGVSVTVTHSYNSTYFMTVGWGPGGYSGIQQTKDTGKAASGKLALFSFWNTGSDNVNLEYVNAEEGVKDSTFGGEGTGRKSWVNHPWVIGTETAMKVKASLVDSDTNTWEVAGYVLDMNGKWLHMATFSRSSDQNPLSYYGFYVFVEDWDRPACGQGFRHKRAAKFTSPYAKVDGKAVQLDSPRFSRSWSSSDSYARNLIIQERLEGNAILMSTGGHPFEGGSWSQADSVNCWNRCGGGGLCENVCGTNGYCCRNGYNDCLNEAQQAAGSDYHSCVRLTDAFQITK